MQKNSNCCNMLGYLSLNYRCSSNKFQSLLGVEIDQNICEIWNHELQFWVAFILCLKMRVQSLSICKSSSKSIGSSIGEVGFLSLHHLYTILGSKYEFRPQTPNEWWPKFPHTTAVVTHRQRSHIPILIICNHLGGPAIVRKLLKNTPSPHKLSIQQLKNMPYYVKQR